MTPEVLILTTLGILLLALGVHNEISWRRRLRDRVTVTGHVVDLVPDDDGDCFPEIEFEFGSQLRRFRSAYSLSPTPFIGEAVKVVTDCHGEDAEYLTTKTRWSFTVIPVVAGLIAILIGFI